MKRMLCTILILLLLSACAAEPPPEEIPPVPSETETEPVQVPAPVPEQPEEPVEAAASEALPWEYLQLAAYIQDGLRAYDVEETVTLYFAP